MSEETQNQPTEQALVPAPHPGQVKNLYQEQISYFPALSAGDPLNQIMSFVKMIKGAKFIPADYRDDERSLCFIVAKANDLHIPWTLGVQSLYMTPQGKLGTQGDIMLSLLFTRNFKVSFPVNTREEAQCKIVRPDGQEHIESFDMAVDAQVVISRKDGVVKKLCDKDNWKNYPKNMLKWRALANCARFIATDVISGLYLMDELSDFDGDSTMGEPTDTDRQRMEVLQAKETADKYKVELKAQAAASAPPIETKAADAGPVLVDQKTLAPTLTYQFVTMMKDGNGNDLGVLCEGETAQTNRGSAELRAQALATSTGHAHCVIEVSSTGERKTVHTAKPSASPIRITPPPAAVAAPVATAPAPVTPITPAPTKEESKTVSPAKARFDALIKELGLPEKTGGARLKAYMAGFAGCAAKDFAAQPEDARLLSLSSAEYLINHDPEEFNAGPEAAGKKRRQYYDAILSYLSDLWKRPQDKETVELGMALFQKWGQGPDQFKRWTTLESVALDFMPMEDVHAALRVLLVTREGVRLFNLAKSHNLSVALLVDQMEKRILTTSVEKSTEPVVKSAIERMEREVKAESRKEPAPPAASAQPPQAPVDESTEDQPPDSPEGEDLFTNW